MIRRRCSFKKYVCKVVSGKSPLIINNSERDRFRSFSVIGKSEQASTNGLNLFNYKDFVDPNTYDVKDGPYYRKYLQLKPNTKYTATVFNDIADNSLTGIFFIGATTVHDLPQANGYITAFNTNGKHSVSFNTGEDGRLVMKALGHATKLEEKFLRVDLIISEGNEIPYEPYTGGKPSPSTEYQQEIKNVGKWNEATQKYEVDVKILGKNEFDKRIILPKESYDIQDGQFIRKYFFLEPNTGYRVVVIPHYNIKLNATSCFLGTIRSHDNSQANGISSLIPDVGTGGRNVPFRTDDTGKMVIKIIGNSTNENVQKMLDQTDIMVCRQELSDDFVPYREPQTLTLTSDRPITKWDKLVEKDGQIGWLYNRKIATIPKTGWLYNTSGFFYKNNAFPDANISISPINETNIFTHFILGNPQSNKGKDTAWLYVPKIGKGVLRVGVSNATIVTPEEFEKYISDKDMKFLYELAAPEFIPLTQSEQDAIRALKTYYPTTVITTDGGEVDPDIEVTYIADTKNYVDQKIENTNKSVIATQKALL